MLWVLDVSGFNIGGLVGRFQCYGSKMFWGLGFIA